MKIGIPGSGNVGGTLGTRWAQGGHEVVFSSREPGSAKMRELLGRAGRNARAAQASEAVAASDVILVSTPWVAAKEVLAGAGSPAWKIVIDALNPLLPDLTGLAVENTTSAAEMVAGWCPGARVVKAFNTVSYLMMADPLVNGRWSCFSAAMTLTQARLLEPFELL